MWSMWQQSMHGWDFTASSRTSRSTQRPARIEARKSFKGRHPGGFQDTSDALLIVTGDSVSLSLNGKAHMTEFDLRDMAEVVSYLTDMMHKQGKF